MSHEIETYGNEAAAVFARKDAWHKLGTVLPDAFTAEEAMTIGHLGNWNVRKTPITTVDITDDGVTTIEIPDRFATVRTNPFTGASEALGVVGSQYTPIQNEEHAELLNALVDESGAHFDTAGSLRGGRDVFVTMKLPDHMMIAGSDELDLYIAALNSHDGTSSFRLLVTPVRVVCANTQRAALGNNRGVFSIRHTINARDAIAEARRSLNLTFSFLDEFQAEADRMVAETLTQSEFERIIRTEFAAQGDTKRAKTAADQFTDQLVSLFADAGTNHDIRSTRWAGYQAVVEYADHFAAVRGAGDDVDAARTIRAERNILGGFDSLKLKAWDTFRVPVAA